MDIHHTICSEVCYSAPPTNCSLCPRLAAFRAQNKQTIPHGYNAPVPSFGELDAKLLIVGLAPGLHGANTTGRPFTADYAGDLLYPTLIKFGLAIGTYAEHAGDGLQVVDTRITNAVRCVPPQNKPETAEIKNCRPFLEREIAAMPNLRVIVCLGGIAHAQVAKILAPKTPLKFAHGALYQLGAISLLSSYHCSRYNTSTRRLTTPMFEDVIAKAARLIQQNPHRA